MISGLEPSIENAGRNARCDVCGHKVTVKRKGIEICGARLVTMHQRCVLWVSLNVHRIAMPLKDVRAPAKGDHTKRRAGDG